MEIPHEKKPTPSFQELSFPIFGVKKDDFKLSEVERLERGGKTDIHLFRLKNPQGQVEDKEARLSIYVREDGTPGIKVIEKAPSFTLKDDLSGVPFTPTEKESLLKGNAILKENLPSRDGGTYNAWVQVDKELNRLEMVPEKRFNLPATLLGKDMTAARERLRSTGEARLEGLQSKDGGTFDTTLRVNILKGAFDFAEPLRHPKQVTQAPDKRAPEKAALPEKAPVKKKGRTSPN